MAEINAKDLTAKTSPATTDSMLLFGTTSNEGAKITVDNMKDWVLSGLSTKTFPNQVGGSSAATLLAQLSTLNSNFEHYNLYSNADFNFNGHLIVAGKIAVLWLGNPKTAMAYNTDYSVGSLPITTNTTIHQELKMNDRTYRFVINGGGYLTIKPLSNSLPADGKPSLNGCLVFPII